MAQYMVYVDKSSMYLEEYLLLNKLSSKCQLHQIGWWCIQIFHILTAFLLVLLILGEESIEIFSDPKCVCYHFVNKYLLVTPSF